MSKIAAAHNGGIRCYRMPEAFLPGIIAVAWNLLIYALFSRQTIRRPDDEAQQTISAWYFHFSRGVGFRASSVCADRKHFHNDNQYGSGQQRRRKQFDDYHYDLTR